MAIAINSLYARRALQNAALGMQLSGNEERRLSTLMKVNYRPIGTSPAQLVDRIHSVHSPYGEIVAAAGSSSELHFSNGTITIDIDANGVKLKKTSTGHYVQMTNAGKFDVVNGSSGKSWEVDPALITHDMAIRTVSICSGGVTKSMDLVASAPY